MKFTPASVLLACLLLFTFNACKKKDPVPDNPTPTSSQYDFTWSNNPRAEHTVTFTSNAPEGHNVSWKIDTSISTGRLAYHIFKAGGVYNVSMVVDSDFAHMVTKSITVDNPFVSFYYSGTPVVGDTILFHFINGSSGKTFTWDFGDGSTYTGIYPVHVYSAAGFYSIKLRVDNKYDAEGNVKINIINDPKHTHKITGNRLWQLNYKEVYLSGGDSSYTSSETFSITPVNKIAIKVPHIKPFGEMQMGYDPLLSTGNTLVFTNGDRMIYYDHVMDTIYFKGQDRVMKFSANGKAFDLYVTGSSK